MIGSINTRGTSDLRRAESMLRKFGFIPVSETEHLKIFFRFADNSRFEIYHISDKKGERKWIHTITIRQDTEFVLMKQR